MMNLLRGRRLLSSCALIGSAATCGQASPGWAQPSTGNAIAVAVDQAASTDGSATSQAPGDIIVTATRRNEKLHDVPISASVLSSASIQSLASNGLDMRVLAFSVPSLNVETTQGRNFPRFYIRGYGNTDFGPFASQPVSLVLDDVVQENPDLKGFPMFDLADVQVYRGPQGTLFGRNAPAGVVSVRSAAPELGRFGGYLSAGDGTFDTATAEGALNIPLGSMFAARVSGQYQHRDDWIHDPITDKNVGGWDDGAIRAQLLFQPDSDFSALLNVHARFLDGASTLWRANAITPGSNEPSQYARFRDIYIDQADTQNSRTVGVNARLKWQVGDLTIQSVSAWEKILHANAIGDIDGGYGASYAPPSGPGFIPFAVLTSNGISNLDQLTQELRISSDTTRRFRWLAGLYYFHENTTANAIDFDGLSGAALDYQASQQKNNAAAVFGSATFDVTDALELRGGLRYTHDHKKFDIIRLVNLSYAPLNARATANNLSWDASATYKFSPDVSVYARGASGFRAPSFGSPTAVNGLQVAKQETVTSVEGGVKSFLFQRRLRADVSIFYYRIHDQQLTAVGGSTDATLLLNAKKTIGYGLEGELQGKIAKDLDFSVSGSYNFTKLKDPSISVAVCATCTVTDPLNIDNHAIIDGNPLPQAPRYIVTASLDYQHALAGGMSLFFRPDLSYRSKFNFFLYESREFNSQPFLNLGLRGGVRFGDGKYEAAVFCRNCTDKKRILEGIDFENLTGVLNDPRIVGAQLTARF